MVSAAKRTEPCADPALSDLDRRLLDAYQRAFPLSPRPFACIARELGLTEAQVIERYRRLQAQGYVTRIGPVFRPRRVGASTLAALAVPPERLEAVARLVSAYDEVNHNYERDHHFNLWFVVTAPDEARLRAVLEEIEARTGLPVLDLPMEQDYHIDLGFPLWC
jgi:DNA-binding Lrp family transcriptional regulator